MKIIIIGAGPGGYETAIEAAGRGIEVVLIESGEAGGTCLNRGCIPTKAMCRSAELVEEIRAARAFGISAGEPSVDFAGVAGHRDSVVSQLRSGVETLLKHKLITFVRGRAELKDGHWVSVETEDGVQEYSADRIIIATGSSPASLPVPGAELPGVLTSDEILRSDSVPERLCVIGAGVIGLEFASVFRSFGSEVTVIEYCKEILPRFDKDIAKRLKQSLSKRGIEIFTQAALQSISACADGSLSVEFERKGEKCSAAADKVLMAVGRRPNTAGLGLENAGIEYSAKGIRTDGFMMTSCPTVYAIGDVNGRMMLAHAAVFQGKKALNHICETPDGIDLSIMPSAVFTMPQAASIGMTEEDCEQAGIKCEVRKSFYRSNGKAVSAGETDGMCKLIVASAQQNPGISAAPGLILGCHIFGAHSADIVQEVCALMNMKATEEEFRRVIHAHPTLGEVIQSAVFS